ncbi:proline--tRNA ligase [Candidatus Ruminimicrobium bovinum]|uniref:proline--tRNA ligase n=1 Tax=Candidatus Ruminimicrobium bovinum TaxID=3242779 RepID=UPI0039B8729B
MYFSKAFIPTLKEAPSDLDNISAKLMVRSGMVRKLGSGLFELLPLGLKTLGNVISVIREEMAAIDGQEVKLPLLLPKELWIETGRWNVYGKELFRIKDRKNAEFALAPTHEEAITDLARSFIKSYKQLPVMLYQFGIKFRDEIRPRFGVMRAREFLMKDAYSFHTDDKDLEQYYKKVYAAYENICKRCGFKYRVVEAASGAIGGNFSHEFMVLADTGEEEIAWCHCGYGANSEKAECLEDIYEKSTEQVLDMEEISTPNVGTIEDVSKFLNSSAQKFIKTIIYVADGTPVAVLVRGDYDINEIKLQSVLGCNELELASPEIVQEVTGAKVGFAGPVNLKKKIKIYADYSVVNIVNGVIGANKTDTHIKNVNYGKDYKADTVTDLRKVVHGDICPRCKKEKLQFSRGIEIGHIFKLGTKYSKSMKATYLDANGKENLMVMGCYGIGVTRILAATIEQSYDENGIIWPVALAAYKVAIIPVDFENENIKKVSEDIYKKLREKKIDVLLDDRDERAGIKFKDADLIGIPYRITVGEKNLQNGNVEFKDRKNDKSKTEIIKVENIVDYVVSQIKL